MIGRLCSLRVNSMQKQPALSAGNAQPTTGAGKQGTNRLSDICNIIDHLIVHGIE